MPMFTVDDADGPRCALVSEETSPHLMNNLDGTIWSMNPGRPMSAPTKKD